MKISFFELTFITLSLLLSYGKGDEPLPSLDSGRTALFLRRLLGTGDPCISSSYCISGRCAFDGYIGGFVCVDQGVLAKGASCSFNEACFSGRCDDDCRDRIINGAPCNEEDECYDGGRCEEVNGSFVCIDAFEDGDSCDEDSDCISGRCDGDMCEATVGIGAYCDENSDCASGRCDTQMNECIYPLPSGEACIEHSDCTTRVCYEGTCRSAIGETCSSNDACFLSLCSNGECTEDSAVPSTSTEAATTTSFESTTTRDVSDFCDPDDTIVLYEGDDCTQDVVGTLRAPHPGGLIRLKASDRQCLENDEARSVMFIGPMSAGVSLEVADDPDSLCHDDYAAIVLSQELSEGETLCVPSFESNSFMTTYDEYTLYFTRDNGLAGKVSQFVVKTPSPNSAPFRPACSGLCNSFDKVVFFDGDACSQNVVGSIALPSSGFSNHKKASDHACLDNDKARSAMFIGPMSAGVALEVADDPNNFCADDYAAVVLTRDLAVGETLCIPTFESSSSTTTYDDFTLHHRNENWNGIAGKVSQFRVTNPDETSGPFTPACFEYFDEDNFPGSYVENVATSPRSWLTAASLGWMSFIDDSVPLNRISIPGTHDSGATNDLYFGFVAAQVWSISDQLDAGIRYFDIRCKRSGLSFAIHHGAVYQNLSFGSVMASIVTFLEQHPTEVVIMRVKEEHPDGSESPYSFTEIWDRYMETYESWFVPSFADGYMPTLGELRGKIFLLDQFSGTVSLGMKYKSQTIQDNYMLEGLDCCSDKKYQIEEYIVKASSDPNLVINHISGVGPPTTILGVASQTNEHTYNFIGSCDKAASLGIIIMDFPGERLIYRIIKSNMDVPSFSSNLCPSDWLQVRSTGGHAELFTGNDCSGIKLMDLEEASVGISYRYNLKEGGSFLNDVLINDKAKSLQVVGPIEKGMRVILTDNEDQLPNDDFAVITLENDLSWDQTLCVSTFDQYMHEFTSDGVSARLIRSGPLNGLDGAVSSVAVYTPSNSDNTLVLGRTPQWSISFSEEGDGWSDDNGYPIMGMYCSGNHCDNKRLLQPHESICRGEYQRETHWFSEEGQPDLNFAECHENEYVGRIACRDSNCDKLKLACYSMSPRCRYDSGYNYRSLEGESMWVADEFEIVNRVECHDSYCGKINLGVRRVVAVE